MSDQTPLEKIKYGILKVIDVSGFKVFDPVARLVFGEEPGKQVGEITRYMIIPIIFVCFCLAAWNFIAPRHKTKSGEVPTPKQVYDALVTNHTLHLRENEKQSDFEATGKDREAIIAQIEKTLAEKEEKSAELKTRLAEVEAECKSEQEAQLEPLEKALAELKAENKELRGDRADEATSFSETVVAKTAKSDELLALLRKDRELTSEAKDKEKELKDQIKLVRDNKPKKLQLARMESSKVANEVQHLKKRLDYLGTGNRSLKVAKAEESAEEALADLENADSAATTLKAAKSVVKSEERASKISQQEYPRAATIWFQVWRSLFTVFIGFVMAAVVAIPIGIMCGLSRIAMACLTPIISVFKPVSPVVWLLIFQIVVGAFFPDPESHPFFLFFASLPWIGTLKVNPAMIYSACTVAMCAVWPALVNTALGVSSVDTDHLNVAKVLKLGLWQRLTKIIIPSSLPLVFAGLRISLGVGWMVLIAAEALSSSDGLGKFVWDEYQNGSSHSFANILLACFVIGIIGFFLDRMMIILQRSVSFDDGAAVV